MVNIFNKFLCLFVWLFLKGQIFLVPPCVTAFHYISKTLPVCSLVCCRGSTMRTSDIVLFCSYSCVPSCLCNYLLRTLRDSSRKIIQHRYYKPTRLCWLVLCVFLPQATRSSRCNTASLGTSSWWCQAMHRPRCWTATASTSWSASRETSTSWTWPTPRWIIAWTQTCGHVVLRATAVYKLLNWRSYALLLPFLATKWQQKLFCYMTVWREF